MIKEIGAVTAVMLASVVNADIIISYEGINIKSGVTQAQTYVDIGTDGSGSRASSGNANYPGNDATYPAVSGSVDAEFSGASFSLGIGGGTFDNTTNSVSFGTRETKSAFTLSTAGVGIAAGIGGVDSNDGFLFTLGTAGLPSRARLQVTSVTLALFQAGENESAVILNNSTGEYITVPADSTSSTKIIDVSSLNIFADSGQNLVDPNVVSHGAFTVMCAEPEVSTGWRLQSVTLSVVPEPAGVGLFVIGVVPAIVLRHNHNIDR
jgi:hypothetical protein